MEQCAGLAVISLTATVFAACSTASKVTEREVPSTAAIEKATTQAAGDEPHIDTALSNGTQVRKPSARTARGEIGQMPIVVNDDVRRWLRRFTVEDRERFRRFLERGLIYREMVETTLAKYGLPKELYFLAMIESGYVTVARSHANAVGIWQFIRATGQRYGLESDYYLEERVDPVRASDSAARYLRDLYMVFQDWYLAMSAYNAGEMRVLGGIMRGNSRDFWSLSEQKKLPPETRDYVPKFLAAVIIGKDPARFGFNDLKAEKLPALASVEIPSPVRLRDVALITGIEYERLLEFNPGVRRGVTPPGRSTYSIWVPAGHEQRVRDSHAMLSKRIVRGLGERSQRRVASRRAGTKVHLVRAGETLYSISRSYGVSVAALKRANGLRSDKIHKGARLRVAVQAPGHRRARVSSYRVRSGDSLFSIARRFGISVSTLKALNGLRQETIFKGQSLKVARGNI